MNPTYLSIGAIFLTLAGLLLQYFGVIMGMKERLTALETKMELFWKAIETNVVKLLKTYPTNVSKDVLLDKMANRELNLEDAQLLRTILIGEMESTQTNNKLAYILILARLESTLQELKTPLQLSIWKKLF